jgi:hypothetical protein
MPKQRITFQMTKTVTLEFEYPVDPFTKANAEWWINHGYCGESPLGKPRTEEPVAYSETEWKVLRSEPPLGPSLDEAAKTTPKRRR